MRFSPKRIKDSYILLSLAAALLAGGCARQASEPEPGASLPGRWYQLAGGAFEPVPAPGQPSVAELPWTVQARVSDLAALDGRLYLAVNGHGLASVQAPRAARTPPEFRYYYDPLLFGYRTLTALVPGSGSLTCHLYFNSLLNLIPAGELPVQGLCLLALHPQDGIYRQLQVPFQASHRGWECVGFAPLSAQEFLLEWKLSGPERVLFQYTRYALASAAETPAARTQFREAWEPRPLEGKLPPELAPLVNELRRRGQPGGSGAPEPSLYLGVRSASEPILRRYAQRASGRGREEDRLLTAHAFQDGELRLLLASDGLLLASPAGGTGVPAARRLPALPAGFLYTGLFVLDGQLYAPWEQADFFSTGAAGIFISGQP